MSLLPLEAMNCTKCHVSRSNRTPECRERTWESPEKLQKVSGRNRAQIYHW